MTFEQFKYVLEVSNCGSFNQAASNLFLTQAALSTSIKNLEAELGQTIFLRNNRGAQLTSFGRDFISYITPICAQLAQLERVCQQHNTQDSITFSVSSSGYRFGVLSCTNVIALWASTSITWMELRTRPSIM